MIISCNMIVDRRDHVQYLTISKSYSDSSTCSLTEQTSSVSTRFAKTSMIFSAIYKIIFGNYNL